MSSMLRFGTLGTLCLTILTCLPDANLGIATSSDLIDEVRGDALSAISISDGSAEGARRRRRRLSLRRRRRAATRRRSSQRRRRRRQLPTPTPPTTVAPTTVAPTTPAPTPSPGPKVSQKAWDHFLLVNELRKNGFTCPSGETYSPNAVPLIFDCRLWMASQLHSQDMADQKYFSHTSKDGRSPWDRASAQGVSANGENIAAGKSTAQSVLDQWHKSNGHCENMGNPAFKMFAAGYGYSADSPYRHYWTQMFKSVALEADQSCLPALTDNAINGVHSHVESFGSSVGSTVGTPWGQR